MSVGRITASDVVPGMSGAPVIRDSDGAVTGVVSVRAPGPLTSSAAAYSASASSRS